jgi:hypothetical protein
MHWIPYRRNGRRNQPRRKVTLERMKRPEKQDGVSLPVFRIPGQGATAQRKQKRGRKRRATEGAAAN